MCIHSVDDFVGLFIYQGLTTDAWYLQFMSLKVVLVFFIERRKIGGLSS